MNRHWLPGSPAPRLPMLAGKARGLRLCPPSLICPGGYFLCLSIKSSTLGTRRPSPPHGRLGHRKPRPGSPDSNPNSTSMWLRSPGQAPASL